MSYKTALAPLPYAARAGAGVTDPLDVTARTTVRLALELGAIDDGAELAVSVETSRTGNVWRQLGEFPAVSSADVIESLSLPEADKLVRVRWAVAGGSATFSVDGAAIQILASPHSVKENIPESVLAKASDALIDEKLEDASDFAATHLGVPPGEGLVSWGDDIRRAVVAIASYETMSFVGVSFDPKSTDYNYRKRFEDARDYLVAISEGKLRSSGVVGAGPEGSGVAGTVVSDRARRWGQRGRCADSYGVDADGFDCADELAP